MSAITIRPALPSDVPTINAIHRHYVLNTVATFSYTPQTDPEALIKYHATKAEHLPYIVAEATDGKVVGYTYASGFRAVKAGYSHTVEISLFVSHEHRKQGIGPLLLSKLLEVLRKPNKHAQYIEHGSRDEKSKIRQVIACMSLDETSWKKGLGLKEFYERFGFVEVGHLRNVGYKFDRWIDTIYLQLSLY